MNTVTRQETIEKLNDVLEYKIGFSSLGARYAKCSDRADEFLARAAEFNETTVEEILIRLADGKSVDYDYVMSMGHYDIRNGIIAEATRQANAASYAEAEKRIESKNPTITCRCGNVGRAGAYPFSTMPGSGRCDDCV